MIIEISSDRPSFKRLRFRQGLNLLVAVREESHSNDDDVTRRSRNGAGKSSFIDIVHFLFGGDVTERTILSADALKEDAYYAKLVMLGGEVRVTRSLQNRGRVVVEGDTRSWPIRPSVDTTTGEQHFDLKDWKNVLGQIAFGLPPVDQIRKASYLSFRTCFSYFARRAHDGGFGNWTNTISRQPAASVAVNLSFLVGLDPEVALQLYDVKKKETANRELGKSIKEGFLKDTVGSTADIRRDIRKLETQAEKLHNRLASTNIVDFYSEYEEQANKLQQEIDEINDANVIDRELLDDLRRASEQEEAPAIPEIRKVYSRAGIELPDVALKRYEEVFDFHTAVVANRKEHLADEIGATESRIKDRGSRRDQLVARLDRLSGILRSGVARNHYDQVQSELIDTESGCRELRKRLEIAQLFETTRANLKVEKAEAQRSLARDHQERGPLLAEAMRVFEEISSRLYDEPANLEIVYDDSATRFRIAKDNLMSEGVNSMQVFTFDLMLAVLLARRGNWPGFLIHDSHLFDGVDGRQIGSALRVAEEVLAQFGGQYLVTINSDDLDKVERETGDGFKDAIVDPVLRDTKAGGLFGFRFSYGDVMEDGLEEDEPDTDDVN